MKKFQIEETGGKRICHGCGEPIKMGDKCLAFSQGEGRYRVIANLCVECVSIFLQEMSSENVVLQ